MRLFVGILLAFFVCETQAEQTHHWLGYDIHYTTYPSTLILTDVAAAHGIVRSDNRLVTNITVIKQGKPVQLEIAGYAKNLLNQQFELEFSEITEHGAIYYLANQIISEQDAISFNISIKPVGETETYLLNFARRYY